MNSQTRPSFWGLICGPSRFSEVSNRRRVNEARTEKLRRTGLRSFLQEREVWHSTSGDDRGLAILACDEGEGAVKAGKDGI